LRLGREQAMLRRSELHESDLSPSDGGDHGLPRSTPFGALGAAVMVFGITTSVPGKPAREFVRAGSIYAWGWIPYPGVIHFALQQICPKNFP
jgi:hypothetical protein